MLDTQTFAMDKARKLVEEQIDRTLEETNSQVEYTTYIVWFSKTLKNWKALVSSTLPDGKYYEVTHNGSAGETYVDTYVKVSNVKFIDKTNYAE